jgi:hypothetical protein
MADGNLVRQSNVGEGSVVFGPSVYELPLLPFEKELIKTIGITEEEYRKFAAEVRRKGVVRPAEYEHLPDVQASGAEPYLISLAISLVLTGVSYLLTPKPKMPEASKQSQLNLGSVNAGNRFTQSRGFDTLNELADYGAPIPIIFGLYKVNGSEKVGGMLVTPKLVWSRMFSHGTQQSAKLMFVVGEQGFRDDTAPDGIQKPELEGIFLGNNALDALHEDFFAVYWKRNTSISGTSRIRAVNLIEGTAGGPDKGDPVKYVATDDDVFLCPSNTADQTTDFCHAYSPANNTQFGVYGAIPNGTGLRVNYETVSIVSIDEDRKADRQRAFNLTLRRIKIVGSKDVSVKANERKVLEDIREQNMEGKGRQYSPRMGVIQINRGNSEIKPNSNEHRISPTVQVGDNILFKISKEEIPDDLYDRGDGRGKESVDDINQTVKAEQLAADDAMQVGEQFAIGNTLWVVKKRRLTRFNPDITDGLNQIITLECIGINESRQQQIGVVSEDLVIDPPDDYIGDGFERGGVGTAFFPVTKISTGLVRNNRPAVVTEIGIKSRVFQRLQGLCAFNTTPTPNELKEFDKEDTTIRSGTYTGTIHRTSFFQVFVRKAGKGETGESFEFQKINHYFAVTGSRPVDQYNFLRFVHPQDLPPTELEFKFVPIPGSELRSVDLGEEIIRLSASVSDDDEEPLRLAADVPGLGKFGIVVAGTRTKKSQLQTNKEFVRKPKTTLEPGGRTIPQTVSRSIVLPQDTQVEFVMAEAIQREKNIGNDEAIQGGKNGAFFHTIFGSCDGNSINEGGELSKQTREVLSSDGRRWMVVKWTVRKTRLSDDHYAHKFNGVNFTWAFISCEVLGSSDGYQVGDIVEFKRGLDNRVSSSAYPTDGSNPFVPNHPSGITMTFSGQRHRVTDVDRREAAIGRTQAYYYEIFGSAANLEIGESKTIIRNYPDGSRKIKVQMTATVKEQVNHFSGETKGWNHPQEPITVVQDSDTTENWRRGDEYSDTVTISSNNPYITSYEKTGFKFIIGDLGETEPQGELTGETFFEQQSQYADISFYRSLVQKSNDSEPEHSIVYINEIVPNADVPGYSNMTIAGLSLKASRNFTSLDQMRVWLGSGLHVKRLHPDLTVYDQDGSIVNGQANGPSNLFTDLVFYLLANNMGGAGSLLKMDENNPTLVNQADFVETSRFIEKQKLFFNGVIGDRSNLRQFISDTAPYFLCNFAIMDGKFSLLPAVPHMPDSGEINLGPVPIDQLFTAGNILEDSFKVEYLRSEERRPFKAVMRYRHEVKNKLPQEKVVEVKLPGQLEIHNINLLPNEQFDLTQFCTSEKHAIQIAKYFLGIRDLVTHTISFSTTVHGLNLRAGSYIKVITTSSPYNSANNGTVGTAGAVTSVQDMPDGQYNVSYFKSGFEDVETGTMTVSNGNVSDSTFHDTVFSVVGPEVSENIYVVEQLTFSEEGTVDIVATEHPCDNGVSKLAKLIASDTSVITVRPS